MLTSLLLAAAFAVSLASNVEIESVQREPCTVRAWVRAEDLSPDHVSRGELRIKVLRAECAKQIASVALRLQLDEFSELKFLKKGAVLPEVQPANQTVQVQFMYADWSDNHILFDRDAVHDEAVSDPELWTVRAEKRRAWTTEATLIENNPDLSQPIVTPFTVAVPAVNYPQVLNRYRHLRAPLPRHAFSDLGYRYIAVVKFTDGYTEDVLAGHTTFVPSPPVSIERAPVSWNITFADFACDWERDSPLLKKGAEDLERCLPEAERSVFVAEITLEDGTVVKKGRPLKGRVTVHSISDGSTTMSDIHVHLAALTSNHWAQAQAAGDVRFFNATSAACQQSSDTQALDPESTNSAFVFEEKEKDDRLPRRIQMYSMTKTSPISPAHPHFDFELEVQSEAPVDFVSYYATIQNILQVRLTVLYSPDVVKCMDPDSVEQPEKENVDDAARTEEGLWDTFTRVGKPIRSESEWKLKRSTSLYIQATVPVTVVGSTSPVRAVVHYLTPGAAAPVLQSGAQTEIPASFPVAQPVYTVEAPADISARLLQPGSSDPYQPRVHFGSSNQMYPDPSQDYRGGNYAGLLWKKKTVAERRGILPLRTNIVDEEDSQKVFSGGLETSHLHYLW
ncbi:hypothetical protein B0H19DRAFT_1251986 [Mycena capillaripes]|nr:hypothetical protein B0H19DRAFT_1251986 [Mycena capillaripes]